MPFDWREFLLVAYELRHDQREAVRRTCLGRAYYYVYNLGLHMARQMHWPEPRRSLHRALWAWCQTQSDINIRRLGLWGAEMYALRIDADYKDQPLSDPQAVRKQLTRALDFERVVAQRTGQTPPADLAP
jgi:hypothetical protein